MKKQKLTTTLRYLQPLADRVSGQDRKTLVLWALDCAEVVLPLFTKTHPTDDRPRAALIAARRWAQGEIKMPEAKRAAHQTHNAATEVTEDAAACAAARSAGHVVGIVHVATHAMGFAIYAVNARIYAEEPTSVEAFCAEQCAWLLERLTYWESVDTSGMPWAAFLQKDVLQKRK